MAKIKTCKLCLKRDELKALLFQHEVVKPFNSQVDKFVEALENPETVVKFYDIDGNSLYIETKQIYIKRVARLSQKIDKRILAKFVPCLRITIK